MTELTLSQRTLQLPRQNPRAFLFIAAVICWGLYLSLIPLSEAIVAAPMVNEVALTLLFGLFGWKIALLYTGLGLTVAIVSGWTIGRLSMEGYRTVAPGTELSGALRRRRDPH